MAIKRKTSIFVRKTHRYLGLFIGIQFIFWTVSGLYFSWSDIDTIHGDHFMKDHTEMYHQNISLADSTLPIKQIKSLELITIAHQPHFWINDSILYDATTKKTKSVISEEEALMVASHHMKDEMIVKSITRLDSVGSHHEYRERPLPAYQIIYDHPDNVVAYVAAKNGTFQRVRHQSWRWFDYLWVTHTMGYDDPDDINNWLLRIFSILGLLTVFSGFTLWIVSKIRVRG